MSKKRKRITFITPDDPEYRFLRYQKNTIVVHPEPITQIIPEVLMRLQQKRNDKD